MPAPIEKSISTLKEFTEYVDTRITAAGNSILWFRGIGDVAHKLVPSLYRHPTEKDVAKLIEMEESILTRFKQRSIPYQTRILQSDWEYFFFMQHFGVPTRFLDWTENPFVALYFAISTAEFYCDRATGAFTADAAVWILDTGLWNGKVQGSFWKNRIFSVPDSPLNAYLPSGEIKKLNALPVAMAGMHNSARIVAQRGAFTIFGHKCESMEQIFEDEAFPAESLIKINFPKAELDGLRKSLFGIGYSDSMIYPDLVGLAKEIKRTFGFGV